MNAYTITYDPSSSFPWKATLKADEEKRAAELAEFAEKYGEESAAKLSRYVPVFTMAYTRIGLRFAIRSEEKRRARKARRTARRTVKAIRNGWTVAE